MIFQRLLAELRVDQILTTLLADGRFEFSTERDIFLTVLHRLFAPGSDRATLTPYGVIYLNLLEKSLRQQSWKSPCKEADSVTRGGRESVGHV